MRFVWHTAWPVFSALAACGGIAVIDPDEGGGGASASGATNGSGATTSSSSTDPSTSTSPPSAQTGTGPSTASGPASCMGLESCCDQLCDLVSTSACPVDECDCNIQGASGECDAALALWYECLVPSYPASIVCQDGGVQPACGVCEAEQDLVHVLCGVSIPCG
jgi:hypothetical protein